MLQVNPSMSAVERLAGAMSAHVNSTGMSTGRKPLRMSLISPCLILSIRARNMKSASFARSEVWKVRLMTGSLIQREPSLSEVPKNKVYTNNGRLSK